MAYGTNFNPTVIPLPGREFMITIQLVAKVVNTVIRLDADIFGTNLRFNPK